MKRKMKVGFREYLFSPVVYLFAIPLVLFHISIEIYHRLAFWGYKIPYVSMREFFIFDRHNIRHLSKIEKVNCVYCSYANGLMAYSKEIAARSERYWCPFKHKDKNPSQPHSHYENFIDFYERGDVVSKQLELRKYDTI